MQLKNVNIPHIMNEHEIGLNYFPSFYKTGTGNDQSINPQPGNNNYKPVPPPKPITPPYRMPPQPPGGSAIYGEASIPGAAAPIELNSIGSHGVSSLRTHSSKFPIERELVLSGDKGGTKIPLMNENRTPVGLKRNSGLQHLLPRSQGAIAPEHPPKQIQAWNSTPINQNQNQQQSDILANASLTGAIPRTPARLPEDVTALAERENNKDLQRDTNKNAVAKTYHTIKDLISSKFKKDSFESTDELNNVTVHQQSKLNEQEDYRSPYSALPIHMRQMQMQGLNQSQPNIWNGGKPANGVEMGKNYQSGIMGSPSISQQQQARTLSQPQLNMQFERVGSQHRPEHTEHRASMANIDVTDSDDGGFAPQNRRPHTMYQIPQQQSNHQLNQQQQQMLNGQRNSPYMFHNGNQQQYSSPYGHQQTSYNIAASSSSLYTPQPSTSAGQSNSTNQNPINHQQMNMENQYNAQIMEMNKMPPVIESNSNSNLQNRQDIMRTSLQRQQQRESHQNSQQFGNKLNGESTQNTAGNQSNLKQVPGSAASSDYDKSGNQSSNVDSGRGSAAYSSGRKAPIHDTSPESSDSHLRGVKNEESEWVDIVDAELRHILEPGMQNLALRPESTVSGSVSSMSPPLPPLSPDSSAYKPPKSKEPPKQEYGMDSYNRRGRNSGPIGPSRAGWPGASVHKSGGNPSSSRQPSGKKYEQALLKRHLFGLDNDMTSTTTRSLDLDSLLGAPWGTGQSVSDSETDTQGIRHIRSQLEGLETMYSEVLKMLGNRAPQNRPSELPMRGGGVNRRRHGSLSSLPSSSVSGRPIRDRRRPDERRKVRDMRGINKRFQRLESHVVTLARSVAHLSSEMRSQHLVTQELERLRDDLTTLRAQSGKPQGMFTGGMLHDPDPPNLTNPKRVKKLKNFFGEDPPLMRLFLKQLGYEKYANLFEAERVGMIELPYLGEERLQKMGVPLGPRLRILQEAQISLCKDTTLCIV